MAKKNGGAEQVVLENKTARAERIRKGFAEIYAQEGIIARQEEDVMQPLKKDRTRMWRNLKTDTDIPRKQLEVEYRRYKLAKQAAEDDDDIVLDNMREVFEALSDGQTVDWVDIVAEREASPDGAGGADHQLH